MLAATRCQQQQHGAAPRPAVRQPAVPRVAAASASSAWRSRRAVRVAASATPAAPQTAAAAPSEAITLTDKALAHLLKLRSERLGSSSAAPAAQPDQQQQQQTPLVFRVGVKQGGCSGLSYVMDFEAPDNLAADDYVIDYNNGIKLACDPKSLLYLFGMRLDYSDALIGGGFTFHNPNATDACGCGKSFGV